MRPENTLGTHLLVDFWEVDDKLMQDTNFVTQALREAAEAANATILFDHYHHFGEEYGVTGILVLAESHISIHTWPEHNFAAADIFLCGNCDPDVALKVLVDKFNTKNYTVKEEQRGLLNETVSY